MASVEVGGASSSTSPPEGDPGPGRSPLRQVLVLAVPALGALVAEPLFLLTDAAIVGTTGADALAGLAVGSALLSTAVGLFIVLAYATTADVGRLRGAGRSREALDRGVDGLWLGLGIGVVMAVAAAALAPAAVRALDTPAAAADGATLYLQLSAPGLPGMLLLLAATGTLRGLSDLRTPLVVAVSAAVVNVVLDVLLVLVLGWGLAGAAVGTALAQTGAGLAAAAVVVARARRAGAALGLRRAGVARSARTSAPLLVRTLGLRVALLVTTAVAGGQGVAALAGHHVVMQLWSLLALALDAVAIAAQVLVSNALGAGGPALARSVLRSCVRISVGAGVVIGAVVALASPWVPALFTASPPAGGEGDGSTAAATAAAISLALVVVAVTQPLAGWVFALDGVLMGAGDGRYLAGASAAATLLYVPVALAVGRWGPGGAEGLAWLWVAFAGLFMLMRAAALGWRVRGEAWTLTGSLR